MMDCRRFQEVLADLDRPGVLPADLREDAFAHAEGCSDCGQLLTETELLDAELRRLAAREADRQAPARIEAQLLRAFRQHSAEAAHETTWRYAAAIGIAAVLLLTVGFWLNRRTDASRSLPGLRVTQPVVALQPAVQPSNEAPATARARSQAVRAIRSAATPAKADSVSSGTLVSDSDNAAAFIPLPDADPGPLDDGAVVRVEMPRAALASFGLPVEAMEGNGTVRADLIVSADGTPQAIRLLSQNGAAAAQ